MIALLNFAVFLSLIGIGCGFRYLWINAAVGLVLVFTDQASELSRVTAGLLAVTTIISFVLLTRLCRNTQDISPQFNMSGRVITAYVLALGALTILATATPFSAPKGVALAMIVCGISCIVLDTLKAQITGFLCATNGLFAVSALSHSIVSLLAATTLWADIVIIGCLTLPKLIQLLAPADRHV